MSEEDEVKMATKESPFNLRFGQSRATHQPSKIKSESMKIGIKLNKAASEVVKNKNKLILENKKIQKVFVDMMTQHNRLYKKWRTADLISAIFALFGLLIAIAEFEIGSDFSNNDSTSLND